ncbi:hypothetical protein ACJX0J_006764, partial [Zea mays]
AVAISTWLRKCRVTTWESKCHRLVTPEVTRPFLRTQTQEEQAFETSVSCFFVLLICLSTNIMSESCIVKTKIIVYMVAVYGSSNCIFYKIITLFIEKCDMRNTGDSLILRQEDRIDFILVTSYNKNILIFYNTIKKENTSKMELAFGTHKHEKRKKKPVIFGLVAS